MSLDGNDMAIGHHQKLTPLKVSRSSGLPWRPELLFDNDFWLHSIDWYDKSAHHGHHISVGLIWQTTPDQQVDLSDLQYEIEIVSQQGDLIRTIGGDFTGSDSEQDTLPADLPPGQYPLNVGMYNPDSGERLPVIVNDQC